MGTRQVTMHEAKTKLSELGELAWKGEKIIIAKAGKPFLDLYPHKDNRPKRKPGRFKNKTKISEDFDRTSEEVIHLFKAK